MRSTLYIKKLDNSLEQIEINISDIPKKEDIYFLEELEENKEKIKLKVSNIEKVLVLGPATKDYNGKPIYVLPRNAFYKYDIYCDQI